LQKLEGKTFNVVQDNIEKLKELFPEVFTEDKVDIDRLRLALGENIEKEKERYEFTWNGKTEAIQLAQKQTAGTLIPCKEESVNWDKTQNLYVEGDNLEVLRILQSSYRNKVKTIFIDPPYNTGKDFVYKDDFQDNVKNYKDKIQGALKSNTETNGRFHTDWLNMMYPRLKISRNLLREDGVIFISIDDHEVYNLKKICDEIFGEENFLANIVWQHSIQPKGYLGTFSVHHNHILVYSKSSEFNLGSLERTAEHNKAYSNPDNDPNGLWRTGDVRNALYRPNLIYTIKTPSGKIIDPPEKGWRWSKETLEEKISTGEIIFNKDETSIIRKIYLKNLEGRAPETIWFGKEVGTTREGNKVIKELFDNTLPFDTPKPVELIKRAIQLSNEKDGIILDFFAGSSTTAHAVMELNAEDNGNRKFIMVQLGEETDETSVAYKTGYKNIAEIGKERIRRAGKKILKDNQDKDNIGSLDTGFKVFKLDDTNLKLWDEESLDLEKDLLDMIDPVKEDRTQEDVVYEILLKYGIDLTVPIEQTSVLGKKIFSIGMGFLIICLERDLSLNHIEEMSKLKPARIVFYDEGFKDDTVRTNAQQILKRYGVEDIRVI
jgi:adenine-specific DNA-methyltransferase